MLLKEEIQKNIDEMDVYVPVRIIERDLGMPKTTLQKVLNGKRELPKKWLKPLESYFLTQRAGKSQSPPKNSKPKEVPKTNSDKKPFISEAIRKKLGI